MSGKLSEQKCSACGAPLRFDPASGKSVCDWCGSSYDISDEGELGAGGDRPDNAAPETLPVYNCESCGAEIVTDAQSASVQCPYCGNNIVLTEQVSGGLTPDGLIPFKFDKKQLPDEVNKFYKDKKLMPKGFFTESTLEDAAGIYVPYWVFDTDLSGSMVYDCTKRSERREGDYIVTEKAHYDVRRNVSMRFEKVPVDASVRLDDKLMESVEPFDYNGLKPFDMSYLSGFFADRFDKGSDAVRSRAMDRMNESAYSIADSDARKGYSSCERKSGKFAPSNVNAKYMLLPVYTFAVKWGDKKYDFAMNGQTGKVVGDVPRSAGKTALLFLISFLISFAAALLLLLLFTGNWLVLPSILFGAVVSGIITLVECSKMKTVHNAVGAREYLKRESVKIAKVMDRYTHTDTERVYSPVKKDEA